MNYEIESINHIGGLWKGVFLAWKVDVCRCKASRYNFEIASNERPKIADIKKALNI